MRDVSRIVKKHLNENFNGNTDLQDIENILRDAIHNDKLPIIGTVYEYYACDIYEARDYICAQYNIDIDDNDNMDIIKEIDEMLMELTLDDTFVFYGESVIWQLEGGHDGLEAGSGEVFDEPLYWSELH